MRNLQNLSSEWYFCIFKNNHFVVMYFKVDVCFWFFKFCIFYANFVGYANYTKWQIRNLYKSWIRYFLHFPTKFQLWGVFWNCHRCGKSSGAIISLIEWKMKKLRDFEWILHTVLWPLKWKPTESISHKLPQRASSENWKKISSLDHSKNRCFCNASIFF